MIGVLEASIWQYNTIFMRFLLLLEEIHVYLQQFIIYWEYEEFYCIRHFCLSFTDDGLQ